MYEPRRHEDTKKSSGLLVDPVMSLDIEKIVTEVIDCAFQVHKIMGPGLLEKIYEECLVCELTDRNIPFVRQHPVNLQFKHHRIDIDYKVDLVIAGAFILELKSVTQLNDIHVAQTMTYMKLLDIRLGLLINFNAPTLKQGIRRIVL